MDTRERQGGVEENQVFGGLAEVQFKEREAANLSPKHEAISEIVFVFYLLIYFHAYNDIKFKVKKIKVRESLHFKTFRNLACVFILVELYCKT